MVQLSAIQSVVVGRWWDKSYPQEERKKSEKALSARRHYVCFSIKKRMGMPYLCRSNANDLCDLVVLCSSALLSSGRCSICTFTSRAAAAAVYSRDTKRIVDANLVQQTEYIPGTSYQYSRVCVFVHCRRFLVQYSSGGVYQV